MSRVFLAEETALSRQVVIKVLPPEQVGSISAERFRREIQVVAQLQHPHIVPVHAAGSAGELLYYVMPFVEGASLRERLAHGALPIADAVRIWRELLDALSYAHSTGVVHRDIKPENILLSGRHASVTDFGVASAVQAAKGDERLTVAGTALGTPAYMSPEQAVAHTSIDQRADLYAAGLVMYEMLAGVAPFEGLSSREMMVAHVMRDPVPLAQLKPFIPATLAALVMRLLAKNPDDRPPNADAVLAELDQAVTPTASSRAVNVLPARPRRRWRPIAAAAVVVIAGVGAWVAKSDRVRIGRPGPPAHDSLRLRIVTASVKAEPADSMLAREVRDGALAEMEGDPWLFVVKPAALAQAAAYYGIGSGAMQNPDTVRTFARRMRTHAIVDFGVSRAGAGWVLTAEARGAATDSSLGVISEAAAGATGVPEAMARLARTLRERLVSARRTLSPTALSRASSDEPVEAIELFMEAWSELVRRNNPEAAGRALAATQVDSTFAQAWYVRSQALSNDGTATDEMLKATAAAYRFRSRIRAPAIRFDVEANYAQQRGDDARALVLYDSIARIQPDATNDLGVLYGGRRQYDLAVRVLRRNIDSTYKYFSVSNGNLVFALLLAGRVDEAKAELAKLVRADSTTPEVRSSRNFVALALRDWTELERLARVRLGAARTANDRVAPANRLAMLHLLHGQLAAFDSISSQVGEGGIPGNALGGELQRARVYAVLAGDTGKARAIADSALRAVPWAKLTRFERPYEEMLLYLAAVRDVPGGQAIAVEWSRTTPAEWRMRDSLEVLVGRGEVALSSGRAREALTLFRAADVRGCQPCFYPRYARAFDALGQADSARSYYERYANARSPDNALGDMVELAATYLRLGELNEVRKDTAAAIRWYEQFTTLWARADTPVLQAKVREARERLDRLRRQRG